MLILDICLIQTVSFFLVNFRQRRLFCKKVNPGNKFHRRFFAKYYRLIKSLVVILRMIIFEIFDPLYIIIKLICFWRHNSFLFDSRCAWRHSLLCFYFNLLGHKFSLMHTIYVFQQPITQIFEVFLLLQLLAMFL